MHTSQTSLSAAELVPALELIDCDSHSAWKTNSIMDVQVAAYEHLKLLNASIFALTQIKTKHHQTALNASLYLTIALWLTDDLQSFP